MGEIYDLKEPIKMADSESGSVTINKVNIEKFKAKHFGMLPDDFLKMDGVLRPKDFVPIAAAVTGLPIETVGEMGIDDLTEIVTRSDAFLAPSRKAGKTQS